MTLMEEVRECGCTDCDCGDCCEELTVAKGRLRIAQRKLCQARRDEKGACADYWIRQVKYLQEQVDRLYRAEKK